MTEPKRYGFIKSIGPVEYGEWVLYSDYADLAAENERRTEQLKLSMSMTDSCIDNINRLTAENERLRKAGDAMRDCVDSDIFPNIIAAWNAAKEGSDAR